MTKRPDATLPQFERDAFAFLGPHPERDGFVVRAFHPAASAVEIRTSTGELTPMTRSKDKDEDGLWEAHIKDASDYRLVITYPAGHMLEVDDPYRYGRVLTDFDLHLFGDARIIARSRSSGRIACTWARPSACTSPSGRPTPIA